MSKHKVKGRTCTLVLDLPNYLDESTKEVLFKIFSFCLDEESKDKVLNAISNLLKETRTVINSLKKSKKHTSELEKGIREFIGIQLNHGFEIGNYYTPGEEEGKEISEVLADNLNYGKILAKLPSTKRAAAATVFVCMDLAILAFETGLMLSYYLSEELVEQHQKELKKASAYIG